MDIEQLSVSQIILLALLVSFVTSIATGIVTVSLLAQAPQGVTNTVNQVVERTIETIVPKDNSQPTIQKTVVVKEDDQITSSIAFALTKTGRVHGSLASTSPVIGLAEALSSGTVLTASSLVDKEALISFGSVDQTFTVMQRFPELGIAVLSAKNSSSTPSFRAGATGDLKLGQTVIGVVSATAERVAIGAVSSKSPLADVDLKDRPLVSVRSIDTTVNATLPAGAPLINIFGDLVGVYTSVSSAEGIGSFVSVSDILALTGPAPAPAASSTPAH